MGHYRSEMVDVEKEAKEKEEWLAEKTKRLQKLFDEKGVTRALAEILADNRVHF